jgi:molybdopterin molybdotransferase
MPEFFTVLPPSAALEKLWRHLPSAPRPEMIPTAEALGRVTFGEIHSPEALPAFPRSSMDGYAVRAPDTFGASATLPAYLNLIGEAPMGATPTFALQPTQCALVHTGGMLPEGADAVVQIENTQKVSEAEIEVIKAVGVGENVVRMGEDVQRGERVLPPGHLLRAQDIGGLLGLGLTTITVAARPRFALLSTGDEVIPPEAAPAPGQIRDINSYTVSGLIARAGGVPLRRGIIRDNFDALREAAAQALAEADALILSAGSSVSVRDMTAKVIDGLGAPGTLVHGVAVKPGKPTILAVAGGKPVFGLPGNPVSAFIIADVFVTPTVYRMQGCAPPPRRPMLLATLTHNLPSAPGREDYVPVRLVDQEGALWAEPSFGKSNLIYTLVRADGVLKIPLDANGLSAGERVEVQLF